MKLHFWLLCCCCSITKSCPTLRPMSCNTPGFPVLHYLLETAQTHVHWASDSIQPSYPLLPPSLYLFFTLLYFCSQSFPASGSFPVSQLFASGGQSVGASATASVFPMNIQSWFPLRLTFIDQWSSLCSRDSQKSSPAPQFESISSSVLSLLYGPTLIPVHDYWKNHSLES